MKKKQKPFAALVQEYRVCLCAFCLPFLSMLLIFISNQIFPFGEESFMHSDMYHQYVPFLREFTRKIREGESLSYSWNIGLGSNYLALFIYYCASPFNWLALLLPDACLIEFMSYMVIFKIGLAGFSFAFYLKHRFRTDSWLILFFSLFYAMSGFVAAYNWNVMWMDCLFLAPLIILGLEQLVKEGRGRLYCIALVISILSNYYISIMLCIFLCLYFLVLLPGLASGKGVKDFFQKAAKACLRFSFYSLLAGGMALVVLIPELAALRTSEYTQFHFPQKIQFYFSLFDMIARHVTGVQNEAGLDHWPNIFCSSAVFMLLPLYVYNRKIPLRQKIGRLLLCFFLLLSFATNLLNYLWHGFNYPNSLPARQSFLYVFLVLTLCFEAVYRLKGFSCRQLFHSFLLGFGYLLLAQKIVTDDALDTGCFFLGMLLLIAYLLLLYGYKCWHTPLPRQILALITLVLITFEATYHMASTSVSVTSRSKYLDPLSSYEALADAAQKENPGFYRFEKFSRTTKNDGALANYPTISCFASTANARAGNWYDRMGLSESKVFYSSDGLTPFTSALLNVRYMFSLSDAEDPSLYTLTDQDNGIYLYRCNYTLPAGFVLEDPTLLSSANLQKTAQDPLALQNQMGDLLSKGQTMFVEVSVENNHNTASFTADTAGHYYAYSKNTKTDTVKMSSPSLEKTYKKVKYDYILDLGWHESGETITLTNSDDNALQLTAYRLDPNALTQVLSVLAQTPFTVSTYDTTHLEGNVTLHAPGTLLLSIPYESGWKLKVNGENTPYTASDELFLSVELPAGTHHISLTFHSPGLVGGILGSFLFLLLFILIEQRATLTKRANGISINKY